MKLMVTTPISVVVEEEDVRHIRAEDETGSFGIYPGHAAFLTVLDISVLTWRNHADQEHHVAVRGGVLTVRPGDMVEVATREAVGEDTLKRLGRAVLDRLREEAREDAAARISAARLNVATMRQLQRYLEAGRNTARMGQTKYRPLGEEEAE